MQIYYFSRTGRSKRIAEELADRYNTTALKIEDHIDWDGAKNYKKATWMSLVHKSVPIAYQKPNSNDEIVVVFPLWAGTLPPAIRTFVKEVGASRLIVIVTSLGSKLKRRKKFKKVIDLVGEEISLPKEI